MKREHWELLEPPMVVGVTIALFVQTILHAFVLGLLGLLVVDSIGLAFFAPITASLLVVRQLDKHLKKRWEQWNQ